MSRRGGISHANGTLVLTQVKVAGNQVWSENGSEVGGGGIASRNGRLVLQDSEVSGNSTGGVPGAFGDSIWGDTGVDSLLHDGADTWFEVEDVLA